MNILDQLEDLERKATLGPWRRDVEQYGVSLRGRFVSVAWLSPATSVSHDGSESTGKSDCKNNADLIVAMRNALPALLRVARAAEEASWHGDWCDYADPCECGASKIHDALAELTKEAQ